MYENMVHIHMQDQKRKMIWSQPDFILTTQTQQSVSMPNDSCPTNSSFISVV